MQIYSFLGNESPSRQIIFAYCLYVSNHAILPVFYKQYTKVKSMIKVFNYIVIFFLMLGLNQHVIAKAPAYNFIDLGLQESDQSEAVAVNDAGQVAGMYWMLGEKYYFIWDEQNWISVIDLPKTANITVLNNSGQLAGSYKDINNKDRGFIWDAHNGFSDIGTLGGNFTRIYDMNDFGQIVGESENANVSLVDGRLERHAFMWQNGSMIDLGALVGDLGILGDRSMATSINNSGQIIGISNFLMAHKRTFLRGNNRSVAWLDGIIEEVDPTMEPQYGAISFTINNNGLATYSGKGGLFNIDILSKNRIAFPIPIGCSKVYEINDNGDIFDFPQHAYELTKKIADCVWVKKSNASENYYDYVGFNYSFVQNLDSNWKPGGFEGARDYNNKCWIVGVAENIYGEKHAALLVPLQEFSEQGIPSDEQETSSEEREVSDDKDKQENPYSPEKIKEITQMTIDASYDFHTSGIAEKVRIKFLEFYSKDPTNAKYMVELYNIIFMLEAMDNIFNEVDSLSRILMCEKEGWFWDFVYEILKQKPSIYHHKLDAYIRLRKVNLM